MTSRPPSRTRSEPPRSAWWSETSTPATIERAPGPTLEPAEDRLERFRPSVLETLLIAGLLASVFGVPVLVALLSASLP